MTHSLLQISWNCYIETNRYTSKPVKLDIVLQQRMKVFIKARELKFSQLEG
ncbi:MAG: hypothetical protein ABIQ04_00205 [Candidatus Saccharimonadales bacterium]